MYINQTVKPNINLLIDKEIFGLDIDSVKLMPEACPDRTNGYLSCSVLHVGTYYSNGTKTFDYYNNDADALKIVHEMLTRGYMINNFD